MLRQVIAVVDLGNIIGSAAADKGGIDILIATLGKVCKIFHPDKGSAVLTAIYVRGNGDIIVVLNTRKLDHARHGVGNRVGGVDAEGVKICLTDGSLSGDAGNKEDLVAQNGEGAHIGVGKLADCADLGQVHPAVLRVVPHEIHFAVHGTPHIKGCIRLIVDDIMRAVANI